MLGSHCVILYVRKTEKWFNPGINLVFSVIFAWHWYVMIWKSIMMFRKNCIASKMSMPGNMTAWHTRDWILDLPFTSIYNMYWLWHYLWSPANSFTFMNLLTCKLEWTTPITELLLDVLRNIVNFWRIVHTQ